MKALIGGPYKYVPHSDNAVIKIWNFLAKHTTARDYVQVGIKGKDD